MSCDSSKPEIRVSSFARLCEKSGMVSFGEETMLRFRFRGFALWFGRFDLDGRLFCDEYRRLSSTRDRTRQCIVTFVRS